ncbi:MAG: hypothetical protein R2713_03725 [Ilumatobacteraceae bacterium]
MWVVATRSEGEFTVRDLRDAEAGLLPLDADTVARLGRLYDIPIRNALPPTERGLVIGAGSMSAGGVTTVFREGDASSMVDAYFHLVHLLASSTRSEPPSDSDRTTSTLRRPPQGGRQRHRPGTSTLEQVVTLAAARGTGGGGLAARVGGGARHRTDRRRSPRPSRPPPPRPPPRTGEGPTFAQVTSSHLR